MSITGFDDAIRDNVQSYSNNLDALRANGIRQRNNALAGIQAEVEKYGEMAKLGLEIPVAVEGLKAVGKRAGDLVNFIKGAPGKLRDAKGAIKTALNQGQDAVSSVRQKLGGARDTLNDAFNEQSDRLDNLRTGETKFAGETKEGDAMSRFNPMQKIKEQAIKSKTGVDGEEMRRPRVSADDLGDNPDPYGRDAPGGDDNVTGEPTATRPVNPSSNPRFEDVDENGLPNATEKLGTGEPSLFDAHEEPRFSTTRPLDAGFENDRTGIGNMGLEERFKRTRPQPYTEPEGKFAGETKEMTDFKKPTSGPGEGDYQDIGEDRGTISQYAPPDVPKTISNEGASGISTAEEEGGSGLGDALGDGEMGIGDALLASGIFAPLGALLEGLGAITEVASVGAGAYGAVQSFSEAGVEETLRKKALPQVSQPTLDLGGRVVAPLEA